MKLDFIPLDKLVVSKTNMRFAKRPPDVSDILPSVRARGILQPIIVRPNCAPDGYEIVAGFRRFTAAQIVADERRAVGEDSEAMPCAILETGDDADAIEASLIENLARADADEVTQWVTFTRLVKQGRSPDDIAATFGLEPVAVRRILALGNLLPRIRSLYANEAIDAASVRHLTLASKRQQQDWLRLVHDPDARAPTGSALKAWLLGGQTIPAKLALFDVKASGLATVADLFGEDRYFADAGAFWTAQDAAIAARRDKYADEGWGVVIIPTAEHFYSWEHEKMPKRKGGRVYIDVRPTGEVVFHEGYMSRKEVERASRARIQPTEKPKRPEVTTTLQTYLDLHRHAATRAALIGHPGIATRLMVAHLIVGSPLWSVKRERQASRDDATRESVENCRGEALFDERRRAVLVLLGMNPGAETVTGGNGSDYDLVRLFLRLLDVPDAALGDVITIAIGETLSSGSAAVAALGLTLGVDMADWWEADTAFFDLVRDKEVLGAMVAEVAGDTIAHANASEKGKTLKRIVTDHLDGADGRTKVERWVPKWMRFPADDYTARGGVGTVAANALVAAAKADPATESDGDFDPDPTAPDALALLPDPDGMDRASGIPADNDDGDFAEDEAA
ncbi:ParB/RepB/Spo0J family partition protein [Sphingomonas immobilis]|uniref:ParB/RepB/Spo0J family partition protein n=1 Tax=Sphingomonas immobilis TaxID=3063997 RepID=A0ABT9A169_9SPHN|nr:ParB/RepB/Spo0J family partition protein [Sphingomonas sp. CA1-15]MDO7843582.1 ParB/RepB/Spo0J family partition protein [Sphingomonas sp. CA1-15]